MERGARRDLTTASALNPKIESEDTMLYWALMFLIIAIIAAIFGFGGIAAAATDIARLLFFVFLVLFVISLMMGLVRH